MVVYYYYEAHQKLYKFTPIRTMHTNTETPWLFIKSEEDPRRTNSHYFCVNKEEGIVRKQSNAFWLKEEDDERAAKIWDEYVKSQKSTIPQVEYGMDDAALEDFTKLISGIFIPELIRIADKHNYDRDNLIKYAANMISVMSEVATFEDYQLKDK